MSVTSILELQVKPDVIDSVAEVFRSVLAVTRAFDGCVSVVVTQAQDDPTRFIVIETWESLEQDAAYRAFRASESSSPLAPVLAAAPRLTVAVTREDI